MIDLHCHSNFSDGTDSIEQIVEKWIKLGLKYVSITDHDTVAGVNYLINNAEIKKILREKGITFIKGIEFSCFDEGDKLHILAYDYDENNEDFLAVIEEGKSRRTKKFILRAEKLKEKHGIEFDEKSYNEMLNFDYIGKPIMARQLINDGVFNDMYDAFKVLNALNISDEDTRIDAKFAMNVIKSAGGLAVWAHPLGGLGEPVITYEEVERIIEKLKLMGLKGLECYYCLYTEDEIEKLKSIAKKHGLMISAGSDYHGKNKKTGMKELSKDRILDLNQEQVTLINVINKNM